MLRSLSDKYPYVIVDVPGRNSRELITGAVAADILVAPHQCSQFDLDTLQELQEQLIQIRDLNPDLKAYAYQAMASTNSKVKESERQDFIDIISEYDQLTLLNSVGYYRRSYKKMIGEGKGATEWNDPIAEKEILDLVEEIGL